MELHTQCGVKSIENDRNVITIKGIKLFEDKILGHGSNGTVVYEGEHVTFFYNGEFVGFSPAAVKCLLTEQFNIQEEGYLNLHNAHNFPNIPRLYRYQEDKGFSFVAMTLCDYDLGRLVQDDWLYAGLLKENGYPSPCLLQLMRDIVTGLKDLHSLSIIHGDLKPSLVLILEDRALVSGMGSSRRLDEGKSSLGPNSTISGTIGWRSPEQILKLPQTPAMDFFTLGCVLFFILTKGKHPFGDDLPDREINVVNNNIVNLFLVEHIPVVKDLVS